MKHTAALAPLVVAFILALAACGAEPPVLTGGPGTYGLRDGGVQPPLHTQGRDLVDRTGRRVKLAAVNWYGASDERFVVGGLNVRHRDAIAVTLRELGFNAVRLPYSDELVRDNPVVAATELTANPDLVGQRALDVFTA